MLRHTFSFEISLILELGGEKYDSVIRYCSATIHQFQINPS